MFLAFPGGISKDDRKLVGSVICYCFPAQESLAVKTCVNPELSKFGSNSTRVGSENDKNAQGLTRLVRDSKGRSNQTAQGDLIVSQRVRESKNKKGCFVLIKRTIEQLSHDKEFRATVLRDVSTVCWMVHEWEGWPLTPEQLLFKSIHINAENG